VVVFISSATIKGLVRGRVDGGVGAGGCSYRLDVADGGLDSGDGIDYGFQMFGVVPQQRLRFLRRNLYEMFVEVG